MNTAIDAYKKINKTEGHPIDDVIKAFYRASNLMRMAKDALTAHDFEACYNHTHKVRAILLVLEVCMETQTPAQQTLAAQLRLGFNSMFRMVKHINLRQDVQVCDALASILENYAVVFTDVKNQVAVSMAQESEPDGIALSA